MNNRIPWSKEETAYLISQIGNGVHPKLLIKKINEKFNTNRTFYKIKKKLEYLKISYAHCQLDSNTAHSLDLPLDDQIKLISLEKEVNLYRSNYKRLLSDLNIQQRIIELAKESIMSLPPTGNIVNSYNKKSHTTEEAVLILSDIHAGEVVVAEDMNDINEYNYDIMISRLYLLVHKIQSLLLYKLIGYNIRKLWILGLGDWISGAIHQELVEGVEGNVVDWTINLAFIFSQMVQSLLQVVPEIEFVGVVGNHGRLHQKPRFKARYVNWDFICYQMSSMFLANDIKNGKVKFHIPTAFWTLKNINNWNWLIMHGDNINSWAGIPWYGITRAIHRLKELLDTKRLRFDYAAMGHFHNHGLLDMMSGQLILNGSVIGGNEFSVGKLFSTGQPNQHFCGIHHREGISWEFKLNLNKAKIEDKNKFKRANFNVKALGELVLEGVV